MRIVQYSVAMALHCINESLSKQTTGDEIMKFERFDIASIM